MPSQKLGIDCPTSASTEARWSTGVCGRVAESTPSGMETTSERTKAKAASCNRRRQLLDDHLIGRLVPDEGIAEIALQRLADEARVLHVPGPVEAHLCPELLDLLRRSSGRRRRPG